MIVRRKQKDYSLISDLRHSGIKRTGKKIIGRTRVKIANTLQKSIDKGKAERQEIIKQLDAPGKTNPSKFRDKMDKVARDLNTLTIDVPNASTLSVKKSDFLEAIPATDRENANKLLYGKSHVAVLGKGSNNILAYPHELGHIKRDIKSGGKSMKAAIDARNNIETSSDKISDSIKNFKNHTIIVNEERGASKEAIKLLKKNGASKEEIKEAKDRSRSAERTYKLSRKRDTILPILKKVELPKWKGNTKKRMLRDRLREAKHERI